MNNLPTDGLSVIGVMLLAQLVGWFLGAAFVIAIASLSGWAWFLVNMSKAKLQEAQALDLSDKVSARIDDRIDKAIDRITERANSGGVAADSARATIARAENWLASRSGNGVMAGEPLRPLDEMPDDVPVED